MPSAAAEHASPQLSSNSCFWRAWGVFTSQPYDRSSPLCLDWHATALYTSAKTACTRICCIYLWLGLSCSRVTPGVPLCQPLCVISDPCSGPHLLCLGCQAAECLGRSRIIRRRGCLGSKQGAQLAACHGKSMTVVSL